MNEGFGQNRVERRVGPFRLSDTFHAPGLVLPAHAHAHACLHFVLEGTYRERVAGCEGTFPAGSVLFKPAGLPHSNRFDAGGSRTLRVEIGSAELASLGLRVDALQATNSPELALLGQRLRRELGHDDDLAPLVLEGLTLELLAGLFRSTRRAGEHHGRAEECAELLRARFRSPWSAAGLARELGCDRTGLARGFRRRFGLTMGDYVRSLRVTEVMRLLARGTPLAEAAIRAGFADQSHCTRVFRRITGQTPGSWVSVHGRSTRPRPF